MEKKVKIIIIFSSLLYILGGSYIFITNLSKKADIAIGPAIEANIALSSPLVEVSQNLSKKDRSNTVILTAKVANNTSSVLTGVKLVMPLDTHVGTLETPSITRVTNFPGQGSDTIFSIPDLPPKTSTQSQVLLFVIKKGTYTIKPYIHTNERYQGTIKPVILSAE